MRICKKAQNTDLNSQCFVLFIYTQAQQAQQAQQEKHNLKRHRTPQNATERRHRYNSTMTT